jgi:light-regulated signal transduction histidine kinase (bacteriophytochrome)
MTYEGLLNIILPEDRGAMRAGVQQSLESNTIYNVQYRVVWPDKSIHWVQVAGLPNYDEKGTPVKMVGVSTEITRQKLFEQELGRQVQERTSEIAQKNIELAKMNDELTSFAYVSSHDLQEPLRKIQTFAGRISDTEGGKLSEGGRQMFEKMTNAAARMRRLIDDLLAYSRLNNSDHALELIPVTPLLDEVAEDMKELMQEKQASLQIGVMCEMPVIAFQFRQLFSNLLSNSLKFASPHRAPQISVKSNIEKGSTLLSMGLSDKTNYCHITYRDNGIGFDPEHSAKIFEVFQRLHTNGVYEGTGIGLAIAKKIVENHHGAITASSEPDKGVTFDIYFPMGE